MFILLPLAYAALGIFIINKWQYFNAHGLSKLFVNLVFGLKILAGTALVVIYTYYYPNRAQADVFKYFDDGRVLYSALQDNPVDYFKMLFGVGNDSPHFAQYYSQMNNWYRVYDSNLYNDSHTIIRFNAFVMLFSFGHIGVHTVVMCFLALVGLMGIYKVFAPQLPSSRRALAAAVFLLPSVVFWGSGVLKEGLLFFAIGIGLYALHNLLSSNAKWYYYLWFVCSLVLLFLCKMYVLIALLPSLMGLIWVLKTNGNKAWLKYAAVAGLCTLLAVNNKRVMPKNDFLETLSEKQRDFISLADSVKSGSIIKINRLEPTFVSFAENAPAAFFNTLLRPFIWEAKKPLEILAALENILIACILLYGLIYANYRGFNKPYLPFCLLFVVVLFVLSGIATPVVGALVRYKTPALPFLVIAVLLALKSNHPLEKWVG